MEHLEGRQSVSAALAARRRRFEVLLLSDRMHEHRSEDLKEAAAELGVPVKLVSPEELDGMTHGRTHGGVVLICTARPPDGEADLMKRLDSRTPPAFLVLVDGVEDARNLGFVLRSAEAFGADAVLVKKHVWDFDGVDVSRASSGAYERLSLIRMDRESDLLRRIRRKGVRIWGCVPRAKRPIFRADFKRPVLLAVGGEKRGLSGAVRRCCNKFATIPMVEGATSLSLTQAAAVVMGEVMRQRLPEETENTEQKETT